jgi:hypothetical protein
MHVIVCFLVLSRFGCSTGVSQGLFPKIGNLCCWPVAFGHHRYPPERRQCRHATAVCRQQTDRRARACQCPTQTTSLFPLSYLLISGVGFILLHQFLFLKSDILPSASQPVEHTGRVWAESSAWATQGEALGSPASSSRTRSALRSLAVVVLVLPLHALYLVLY